jgi:hypothetical protein
MLNFEVRCGMTKWEFDLRLRVATLREEARLLREEAVSHYKWSVHCPSIESNAWWQMGLDCDQRALDKERQANGLEVKADFYKRTMPYVIN